MKKIITCVFAYLFVFQLTAQISTSAKNEFIGAKLSNQKTGFTKEQKFQIWFQNSIKSIENVKEHNLLNKSGYTLKHDSFYYEGYFDSMWNPDSYYTYKIDDNGVLNSKMIGFWESFTNSWYRVKDSFEYDNNGNISINYGLDYTDSGWQISAKNEFNYDSKMNLISILTYGKSINDTIWTMNRQQYYQYNSNNVLIEDIASYYNFTLKTWIKGGKNEYLYVGANINLINKYGWNNNANDSGWILSEKDTFTYQNNLTSEKIVIIKVGPNGEWKNDKKLTYVTDSNFNTSSILYANWNGSAWETIEKDDFYYDHNTAFSDIAFKNENFTNILFSNKPDSLLIHYGNVNLDYLMRGRFFYKNINTSGISKTINNSLVKAYPNPATDIVNFDLSNMKTATEIQIFDVNGKQVLKQDLSQNNSQINISELSKGFYLYKIFSEDNISSGKLIVE